MKENAVLSAWTALSVQAAQLGYFGREAFDESGFMLLNGEHKELFDEVVRLDYAFMRLL